MWAVALFHFCDLPLAGQEKKAFKLDHLQHTGRAFHKWRTQQLQWHTTQPLKWKHLMRSHLRTHAHTLAHHPTYPSHTWSACLWHRVPVVVNQIKEWKGEKKLWVEEGARGGGGEKQGCGGKWWAREEEVQWRCKRRLWGKLHKEGSQKRRLLEEDQMRANGGKREGRFDAAKEQNERGDASFKTSLQEEQ